MTFDKYKIYLYTAIIAIALIIAIYYYGRKSVITKPQTLPQDVVNGALTEAEKTQTETLAVSLYDDMKGVNIWFNRNYEPHKEYLALSDKMFVAVYNKFNQKYFASSKQTLKQWYEEEDNYPLIAGSMIFVNLRKAIINKMNRLKLN